MELSDTTLFQVCISELQGAQLPLHYEELTRRALQSLLIDPRVSPPLSMITHYKERVREKMLQAAWHGLPFYTYDDGGALGGLRSWFHTNQGELFNNDTVVIPGNASCGADGAFEALERRPYLQQKNLNASQSSVNRACANGHVLEHHIAQWFAIKYPDFYCPKDSTGHLQWRRDIDFNHDFKLRLPLGIFKVDVAGPRRRDGKFTCAPGKQPTDIHLCCAIHGPTIVWYGVERRANFQGIIIPETTYSPIRFLVWLNCLQAGLDYRMLRKYAQVPGRRT